ncbi:uncharacterized protein LOC116288150 [Actinia tenebrosa]|uniref:Uncharacterized protein LOC116288150 n=1 Tax=Actinia tenebrosa TaxID=6105 RepID=A0A6P8H5L6_ACTTE|nr:uncharacterized protein LOC116288150 [Actinia tenebrosa]
MAAKRAEAPWLSHAKEDISSTKEWKELVSEVFEAVRQQLTENHVSYFSDLTDSEKILFLDRASKLVRTSFRHSNLVARVSAILDQQINDGIMEELMNPSNKKPKTELVLDSASDACADLLKKWPDLRSKLLTCLNRPLPLKLRKVIWEMFLLNPKIRDEYLNRKLKSSKTNNNTNTIESSIEQRCEAFLASEQSFQGLSSQHSSIVIYVMKNCLTYKHSSLKESLADTDYLLILPFVKVLVQDISIHGDSYHGDSLNSTVANFVGIFFTFMELRPTYMKDSGTKEFHAALKEIGDTMATILESQDHQLAASIVKSFAQGNNSASLASCLSSLMRSYLRSSFVGYLPMDVVCYIWDQHILSMKLQKLNCIPTFAVVLLILLKDKILMCHNEKDVEEVLLSGAKELKTRQFQNEIDERFMPSWKQQINDLQGSELPLVDPVATLGATQPWTWWFQERPATRQRPEDRQAAREAREMERLLLQKQRRKEEIQRQREEEQTLRDVFNKDKQTQVDKITSLEHELTQERQTRHLMEQEMSSEIRQLQEQLARFQAQKGQEHLAPSRHSLSAAKSASLPPTPVSSIAVPQSSQKDEVKNILKGLLSQAMYGVNHLIHGTAQENEAIQEVAKQVLKTTRQECEKAQLTLFGKELSDEDWINMTTEQRYDNKEILLNKLKELHRK